MLPFTNCPTYHSTEKLSELKKEMEIDSHKIPTEELFRRYGVNPERGHTAASAKAAYEKHGPNALTHACMYGCVQSSYTQARSFAQSSCQGRFH